MISKIINTGALVRVLLIFVITTVIGMAAGVGLSRAGQDQKMFSSPGDAVSAMVAAVRDNSEEEFIAVFGAEGKELFSSGDAVSDEQGRERFLKAYDEKHSLISEGENMVLEIGSEEWPFPIPLVKEGDKWFFDTIQGKDEILDRRIGRNELDTIQVCLAFVDAQREYAIKVRDAASIPVYAEKFKSDAGQRNGLYWETAEGEEPSPLGPGVARAKAEGYGLAQPNDEPVPFHGYFYRILKAQGADAPGGAYDYVVNGRMIGGFAAVAYPAQYGNSGVMTFTVNHDGVVYQKDLGEDTPRIAKDMSVFNPDASWEKVSDPGKTRDGV